MAIQGKMYFNIFIATGFAFLIVTQSVKLGNKTLATRMVTIPRYENRATRTQLPAPCNQNPATSYQQPATCNQHPATSNKTKN